MFYDCLASLVAGEISEITDSGQVSSQLWTLECQIITWQLQVPLAVATSVLQNVAASRQTVIIRKSLWNHMVDPS